MDIFEVRKSVFDKLTLTTMEKVQAANGSFVWNPRLSFIAAGTAIQIDITLANTLTDAAIMAVGPVRFANCQIHVAATAAAELVGGSPQQFDVGELWSGQAQTRTVQLVIKQAMQATQAQPYITRELLTVKAHARFVVEDLFVGARSDVSSVFVRAPIHF